MVKDRLQKRKDYLISAYQNGISTCELGRELGCSNASVYLFLRDVCGVEMRKLLNIADWDKDIKELAEKGYSGCKIAKELDLPSTSVRRYMKKHNLKVSDWKHTNESLYDYKDEIITMYKNGASANKVGKKFGYNETSILNFLKKNNEEVRGLRIYDVDEDFFENIDTEAKAYILGFSYGDGNNSGDALRISITDKEVLEMIKQEMKFNGPIKLPKLRPRCKQQYLLDICSRKLCQDLTKQGCMPNKTYIVKFPTIDIVPNNLVQHFVRGLFDADGTLGSYTRLSCSITGTKYLLEGLQKFLEYEIGWGGSICRAYPKTDIIYKWSAGGNTACRNFVDWMYEGATLYMDRKFQTAQQYFLS